jgi:hypothetical protein
MEKPAKTVGAPTASSGRKYVSPTRRSNRTRRASRPLSIDSDDVTLASVISDSGDESDIFPEQLPEEEQWEQWPEDEQWEQLPKQWEEWTEHLGPCLDQWED